MSEKNHRKIAAEVLREMMDHGNVVVLTGAGVSTASGIPDFRSPTGLYSRVSPRVFELDFFLRHPDEYYRMALKRIHTMASKEPNDSHRLLALLEKREIIQAVITQNIDGLHQKAGSESVIELHGNLSVFGCLDCKAEFDRKVIEEMVRQSGVPRCKCGGLIKPCVVFFGEQLPYSAIMASQEHARNCDLFVSMGTSLSVFPAADLPIEAVRAGGRLIILNNEATQLDRLAKAVYSCNLEEISSEIIMLLNEAPQNGDDLHCR